MRLKRLELIVLLLLILSGSKSYAITGAIVPSVSPSITQPVAVNEEATMGDIIYDLKQELVFLLESYSPSAAQDEAISRKVDSIIRVLDESMAQKDLSAAIPAACSVYKPLIDAHDATEAPVMIDAIQKLAVAHSRAITRVTSKDYMTRYSVALLTELTYIKSGAALNDFSLDRLVHDLSGALSKSISTEIGILNGSEGGKKTFDIDAGRIAAAAPAIKTRLYLLEGAYKRYFGPYLTGRMPRHLTFALEAPQNKYDIQIILQSGLIEGLKSNAFENLSVTVNGTLVSFPLTELPSGQAGLLNFRFSYDGDAASTIGSSLVNTAYLTSFRTGQAVEVTYAVNGIPKETFGKPLILGFELKRFDFAETVDPSNLAIFRFNKALGKWEAVGGVYDPVTHTLTVNRMSLSQYTVLKSKLVFSDVKDDAAKRAVNKLLNKGIIKPDAAFNPSANITRESFVAWIAEAYGLDSRTSKNPFTDVAATSVYKEDILAVYGQGIIGGKTATLFNPKGSITKQEMAQILSNALVSYDHKHKSTGLSAKLLGSRTDVATWSRDSVSLLLSLGFLTKADIDTLNQPVTKQTAALLVSQIKK